MRTCEVPRPAERRARWAAEMELRRERQMQNPDEEVEVRERTLERRLRMRVASVGGWAPKWASAWEPGVPDRIVFLPGGGIYFVELKAHGKRPTPLQLKVHGMLETLGARVVVLDSAEAIDAWVDEVSRDA